MTDDLTPFMPEMTLDGYTAQCDLLGRIVAQYRDVKGTVSQRRNIATMTALGQTIPDEQRDVAATYAEILTHETVTLADLAEWHTAFVNFSDGLRDSMVSEILAAESQSADEVAAIKAQYDAQRDLVNGLGTVLKAMGVDVDSVVIPVLRSTSPSAAKSAGSKSMRFYRIINGVRKDQADSTNTPSTFAFHHAAKMTGQDSQGSHMQAMLSWLEANVDNDSGKFSLGKSWSVEVNGVTYGCDVAAETTSDD